MSLPTLKIRGKLWDDDPAVREKLSEWIPYEYILDWINVRKQRTGINNRVLVLKSETASGKSTLLPPVIYERFVNNQEVPGLICTQPRVMTAIENVYQMLPHYKFLRLGETIGWSTQNNKVKPQNYGLLSATIGTLTQQLKSYTDDEMLRKYSFILIDETHERDHQTDLTIMMLKYYLQRVASRVECPFVILMSATFDPQPFLDYFDLTRENFIWCKGEAAGFDKMWDWNQNRITNNYPKSAAEIVYKICIERAEPSDKADILIFLPGKQEFRMVEKELRAVNTRLASESPENVFALLQIDGEAVKLNTRDKRMLTVPVSEQTVMMKSGSYKPYRRVILSTVVAETGLTLDNLKYVIDSGFSRSTEFNPVYGFNGLITKPAPKSRITQRMGRAGRKFRGVFYPLYPEYIYNQLPDLQFPEILTADVTPIILDIFKQQVTNIEELVRDIKAMKPVKLPAISTHIDMIDSPSPDALWYAIEKMYSIGFIGVGKVSDDAAPDGAATKSSATTNLHLTEYGIIASTLTSPDLSPECVRLILAGYTWNASTYDLCTIAAYIKAGSKGFALEKKKPINWDRIYANLKISSTRELICDDLVDGLVLLHALSLHATSMQQYLQSINVSEQWALNFLSIRDSILESLLYAELNITTANSICDSTEDTFMDNLYRLKHCIVDAFRTNVLVYDGVKYTMRDQQVVVSLPCTGFKPKYLIYTALEIKSGNSIYQIKPTTVSSIDGFVSVDENFLL